MKAIQVSRTGPSSVLEYTEVPTPAPGPGEVLVRTESISVNYADVRMRQGLYPKMPPLPFIPGTEASGTVVQAGDKVTNLRPGQRVVVMGGECYAEYVKAGPFSAVAVPDGVEMDSAAAFPTTYLTSHLMLHHFGRVEKGQTVLLYPAAGGIGTAVGQLASLAGIEVIGLVSGEGKADYAKSQGIAHVINYRKENVPARVMELTGGKGVRLIMDHVAGPRFSDNLDMLAPLGQVIWFGSMGGDLPADLAARLNGHFMKGIALRSFHLGSTAGADPMAVFNALVALLGYLKEGTIRPVIYRTFPLAEASKAHDLLESGAVTGKLILKP
jgi:NADPH:quinone reductase